MRRRRKPRKRIKYEIAVEGRTWVVEGYERFFIGELGRFGFRPSDVERPAPEVPYRHRGRSRTYEPDFYVRSLNLMVEVKSQWTMRKAPRKNEAKWLACVAAGYGMLLLVYGGNGKIVEERWIRRPEEPQASS